MSQTCWTSEYALGACTIIGGSEGGGYSINNKQYVDAINNKQYVDDSGYFINRLECNTIKCDRIDKLEDQIKTLMEEMASMRVQIDDLTERLDAYEDIVVEI